MAYKVEGYTYKSSVCDRSESRRLLLEIWIKKAGPFRPWGARAQIFLVVGLMGMSTIKFLIVDAASAILTITLLRRKPRLRAVTHFGVQARALRPWMNARGVSLEARKERSGVCFGGFRPPKHVEERWALARGAPLCGVE